MNSTLLGSGVQGIVTKWSETGEAGYGLFVGEIRDLSLRLGGSDGDEVRASTGVSLRESAWHLVAGTFDAEAEEVRLYQEELPKPVEKPLYGTTYSERGRDDSIGRRH